MKNINSKIFYILLLILTQISCGKPSCDYITKDGIQVSISENNAPSQVEVERWTHEIVNWWIQNHSSKWENCIKRGLQATCIYFEDKKELIIKTNNKESKVFAYTEWGNIITIGTSNPAALVKHELGHIVAWGCAAKWEEAHNFFKEINYPW